MTNDELKNALSTRVPVSVRNRFVGETNYQYVSAVVYRCPRGREIIVSAEVTDYNGNSVTIAKAEDVFFAKLESEEVTK